MSNIELFECQCRNPENTLRFVFDDGKENSKPFDVPELYTEIRLNQHRNIFKRIWVAIKYVFGYQSRFGVWDTWILQPKDANRLIEMLIAFKKCSGINN